jgi:RNA polymerase sigma-70 factor (ECF subfamily)
MVRLLHMVEPPEKSSPEDELAPLAEAAARGDASAMRTLLIAVGPDLLRVVRRLFGAQHPEVEDVSQECAVALVQAIGRFRGECSTRHFAARVALHTSMAARRRSVSKKRSPTTLAAAVDADETASNEPGPETNAVGSARAQAVRALCDELPDAQAEVLALHFVLGYTVQESATLLAAPVETIRSRLRLAKRALRTRVLGHPELDELNEETA